MSPIFSWQQLHDYEVIVVLGDLFVSLYFPIISIFSYSLVLLGAPPINLKHL